MTERERKYRQQGVNLGRELHKGGRASAGLLRQALAQTLKLPETEAVRRVVADYQGRLDALPSLTKYPELRGVRECVCAYDQGLADGAGVPLEDVIVRANYLHTITAALRTSPHEPTPCATPGPGCTLVHFPHSDRGPLVANNNDGTVKYAHHEEPFWIVANRAGVILGCVSSGLFEDEVSPESFPAPVFLMVDELCGATAEAVDLFTRLNLFWGSCNTLVADSNGNSVIIEKSTCRYGLRNSTDGFAATTEMSAEDPAYKAYLWGTRELSIRNRGLTRDSADWVYWKTAERRSARLLSLVKEASKAPTFEKMEQIIYDHTGQPEQVHMDGSKCHPDQEAGEWSLRTAIWVVNEQAAQYSFAEPPISGHLTPRRWKKYDDVELVF